MAVNPHAETYQGKTQFSGPVKAGTRWNGPNADYQQEAVLGNPIAVKKLANAGYVACSQSCAVEQHGSITSATDIVLPAGSMVLSIQIIVTALFNAVDHNDLKIYFAKDDGGVLALTDFLNLGAIGVYNPTDIADSSATAKNWINISEDADVSDNTSVDILVDSGASSSAWAASHDYLLNEIVTNDSGKYYYCSQAGESAGSGGPTGSGAGEITDNAAKWFYFDHTTADRRNAGRAILTINYVPGLFTVIG